jgi:hypothetical protein
MIKTNCSRMRHATTIQCTHGPKEHGKIESGLTQGTENYPEELARLLADVVHFVQLKNFCNQGLKESFELYISTSSPIVIEQCT